MAGRDVYANLLRDTRGLRRDQAKARDAWYSGLSWERKEETLFELEMILKGFACFGNPRNHPGPGQSTPAVAHDFREELRIVRDGLRQAVELIRGLLGEHDKAYGFSRYLEAVVPEDTLRSRLLQEQLTQDTPEESLFVLRNTFGSFLEIADGLLRLGRIPHRLHFALLGMVSREIGRNAYFNPLIALEFRPEFDRIRNAAVLEALSGTSESAHRIAALALLSFFRMLRYVELVEADAVHRGTARRAYVILAVLRSDARALTRYLVRRAPEHMADTFERQILRVPAAEIRDQTDALADEARRLGRLRATLESLAAALRVELRRTFEHELPAPDADFDEGELSAQLVVAMASLRAFLEHAIETVVAELAPEAPLVLGQPEAARRFASARLRRDIWMFRQILKAFVAKAEASEGETDRWAGVASFRFVREFLSHFRAIGYQLVRGSDYPRLDAFLASLDALRDVDLLERAPLEATVAECRSFLGYLDVLFEQISRREELAGEPFDKRAAAEHLRLYLGAA